MRDISIGLPATYQRLSASTQCFLQPRVKARDEVVSREAPLPAFCGAPISRVKSHVSLIGDDDESFWVTGTIEIETATYEVDGGYAISIHVPNSPLVEVRLTLQDNTFTITGSCSRGPCRDVFRCRAMLT